ncbi:MAG: methyltransferase domain-containing protein [Sporomusaceae bacterium]|nr:methyltransferase domain-containing protein [Sporomusaceae bacterium]
MKTSIIIWGSPDPAAETQCCEALRRSAPAAGYEFLPAAAPVGGYGEFNRLVHQATGDAILFLRTDCRGWGNWLSTMLHYLYSDPQLAAVEAAGTKTALPDATSSPARLEEALILSSSCLLVKKQALTAIGGFDASFTPGSVGDADCCFRLRLAGYRLLRCSEAAVIRSHPRLPDTAQNHARFRAKWGFDLAYATSVRDQLIQFIDKDTALPLRVLEIGCACGATLLEIKNRYPQVQLFGIEYNRHSAALAATVAETRVDDIEKAAAPPQADFDYIIVGDVLEHLVDPWKTLKKLGSWLKPDGHILAGIPNVMHISVIRSLLQGNWTYQDAGLLDRTHLRFFTLKEIVAMFTAAGYRIREYHPGFIRETPDEQKLLTALLEINEKPELAEQFRAYNYVIKASLAAYQPETPRFVTLFPETENIHLLKDVGMIPYHLSKHFNYKASIATYKNGTYPYLANEVRGLRLEYLERRHQDPSLDAMDYLRRHALDIDILQVFHLIPRTLDWINLYKDLNPSGKVYLKLDASHNIKDIDIASAAGLKICQTLSKCDLISVETRQLADYLNSEWPLRVEYIPNGCFELRQQPVSYDQKENVILTVGRIGSYVKANEVLLSAFLHAYPHLKGWQLKLVGPVTPEFRQLLENYLSQNEKLRPQIILTGEISDRQRLEEEYAKAKLFCLTSRWESFGIVLAEAARSGCFLLTSDVISAKDLTSDEQYGRIFAIDNVHQLTRLLIEAGNDETLLEANCGAVQAFAKQNFCWESICSRIHQHLLAAKPVENAEIAELRDLIQTFCRQKNGSGHTAADQTFIDRLAIYPVALKLSFWQRHSEYQALSDYPLQGPLLDFGCGSGHMDILLARSGRMVHGIDISPLGIAIARHLRAKEPAEIQSLLEFSDVDVSRQPADGRRYDSVWAAQVFDQIADPAAVFAGLRNWVNNGALMLITQPLGQAYPDPQRLRSFAGAAELEAFLSPYIRVIRIDTDPVHRMLRALCQFSENFS